MMREELFYATGSATPIARVGNDGKFEMLYTSQPTKARRLNPKTLRVVSPLDDEGITNSRINLLRRAVDAEKAGRCAAELREIDREFDGFKKGIWFGVLVGSPLVAGATIIAARLFGWLP